MTRAIGRFRFQKQKTSTLLYIVAGWQVLDSYTRYLLAQEHGRTPLVEATEACFLTQEAMKEGNPPLMLERGDPVEPPPTLILQGTADDYVPLSVSHRLAEAYCAAGGAVELELFPEMPHGFARNPDPESDRALERMKAFVARQLKRSTAAV